MSLYMQTVAISKVSAELIVAARAPWGPGKGAATVRLLTGAAILRLFTGAGLIVIDAPSFRHGQLSLPGAHRMHSAVKPTNAINPIITKPSSDSYKWIPPSSVLEWSVPGTGVESAGAGAEHLEQTQQ